MVGMFQENGPCEVIEMARDVFGTRARDWGWDRSSNLLYIDQPNQSGFSYDILVNGTLDLISGETQSPPSSTTPSNLELNGTFSSERESAITNTTETSAYAVWHMLQGFWDVFPQYNPSTLPGSNQSIGAGLHLFTESYGGRYGPIFASIWSDQNRRRGNGSIPSNGTFDVTLTSLGIMNGCVDDLVQAIYYPQMASNNTYGIDVLSANQAQVIIDEYHQNEGCEDMVNMCRAAALSQDPSEYGGVNAVSTLCSQAQTTCDQDLQAPFSMASSRSVYDIRVEDPDSFPPETYLEYLNSAPFQQAIGAPINFTQTSLAVLNAFVATGDYERTSPITDLTNLLASGIRISLIYGDSDYLCNWPSGNAVSLALASQAPSPYPTAFPAAGFADVIVNSSYVGGAVRQFGNLSFVRVYDSGHLVPAYQPETAFTLFTRVITGKDLATGKNINLDLFGTTGPGTASYQNQVPPMPDNTCYVRAINKTCTSKQINMLQNGEGVIINGVLYDKESDWTSPALVTSTPPVQSGTATFGGPRIEGGSTSTIATGVYVATGTPPKRGDAGHLLVGRVSIGLGLVVWLVSAYLG
jgi:carboxypeptidase C (cathepsin A)